MSTINTTVTHYIYYGSGLTYSSPLTITNTGAVLTTAAGRAAIEGTGGGTLTNDGTIIGSGAAGVGVDIAGSGGTVFNSGFIQGYVRGLYLQGSGYVSNSGTILATGPDANAAAELIGGGTLINTSTIINRASSGDGVRIDATGAAVTNSGLIQGYAEALGMEQAGVVLNMGIIQSSGAAFNADAVFQGLGGGTLTNQGTIITDAAGGNGVLLDFAGGTVINSNLIQAYDYGIEMEAAGLITNSGTILSTGGNGRAAVAMAGGGTLVNQGSIVGRGFAQAGVEITGSGDTVNNSGFIQGEVTGLELSGPGVVINSGIIQSTARGSFFGEADVVMPGGGSFTNTQSGYVNNGVLLNVANDGVGADSTVVNAGTITGGLYVNAELGGSGPIFAGTGTVFDSGTITGSPFAIYFGGTNDLLVLQHGYHLNGLVDAAGTFPHTLELQGSAGAPVTVNFNTNEFRNFGTVGFVSGNGNVGTLALAASTDVPGTIVGFTALGDAIDLQFISDTNHDATAVLNPTSDQLTVTGDNTSVVLQLDPTEDYSAVNFNAVPDAAGS
jgi:fibronectin-binding autotransporter adhesin